MRRQFEKSLLFAQFYLPFSRFSFGAMRSFQIYEVTEGFEVELEVKFRLDD